MNRVLWAKVAPTETKCVISVIKTFFEEICRQKEGKKEKEKDVREKKKSVEEEWTTHTGSSANEEEYENMFECDVW